ncbi:unnamed protein product [Brugia pahangi]|uniref:ANK_REP_REGION domain-containing protein n=1 Tax=Brugia pahangi TaxID=6280 RepID=A0A0N4TB57_BRUPA|nr:unnamed protein product [Brugia pahangi]
MDHSDLVAELGEIEKMTPAERIALARERRRIQLRNWDEREKQMTPTLPRRQRLKFSPEVALLEATSRGDAVEVTKISFSLTSVFYCFSVERLLLEGANPNSHNEDGLTPLHQASLIISYFFTLLIFF